jgi:integrase
MDAGDWLALLRAARSQSSWLIAYSAMAAFGRAAGLGDIRAELKQVGPPRRPPTVRRPVPPDAWAAIAARVDRLAEPDRSVMEILVLSGLRQGDLLGITRAQARQIVETGNAPIFEKGDREREWAPAPELRQALGRLLAIPRWECIQDLVARRSRKTAEGRVRRLLTWICRDVGVPRYVPHALRHSVAVDLDEGGSSLQEIAAVLGHASPRTTLRYLHISAARQAGAAGRVAQNVSRRGAALARPDAR